MLKLTLFACLLTFTLVNSKSLPVAMFHGFGDACANSGMASLTKEVGKSLNTYTSCVEVGNGASDSVIMNFEK